jgi:hypothetical protein
MADWVIDWAETAAAETTLSSQTCIADFDRSIRPTFVVLAQRIRYANHWMLIEVFLVSGPGRPR